MFGFGSLVIQNNSLVCLYKYQLQNRLFLKQLWPAQPFSNTAAWHQVNVNLCSRRLLMCFLCKDSTAIIRELMCFLLFRTTEAFCFYNVLWLFLRQSVAVVTFVPLANLFSNWLMNYVIIEMIRSFRSTIHFIVLFWTFDVIYLQNFPLHSW